ncbi:carboxymuconolactone decarboxylase family protein [Burkholderia anthina]|uniref:carboxymuconolactone decarboxylase family protein n=1 Tax=Burkholderia anthina TaxID=179879 RepID=UPI00158B6A70|nr:peroxidase [Burkholderia anthina]
MPFFKSLPGNAGPPNVFKQYPEIYGPWSTMSQVMMNGPSPLSQGERELILAYAAGAGACEFVCVAHSEVAYAWGVPRGLVDALLADLDDAPVDTRMKALLAFVRKLMTAPNELCQADADAVFDAGWSEQALHDTIAITARAAFMQRLVAGHGFTPLDRETAAAHAQRRVERGYVNLYRTFRTDKHDE